MLKHFCDNSMCKAHVLKPQDQNAITMFNGNAITETYTNHEYISNDKKFVFCDVCFAVIKTVEPNSCHLCSEPDDCELCNPAYELFHNCKYCPECGRKLK